MPMARIMGPFPDGSTRLSLGGEQVRPYIGIDSFAEYAVVSQAVCIKVTDGDLVHVVEVDENALAAESERERGADQPRRR